MTFAAVDKPTSVFWSTGYAWGKALLAPGAEPEIQQYYPSHSVPIAS
jgi:hypothetical protein